MKHDPNNEKNIIFKGDLDYHPLQDMRDITPEIQHPWIWRKKTETALERLKKENEWQRCLLKYKKFKGPATLELEDGNGNP